MDYSQLKDAFVSGNAGSSVGYINNLSFVSLNSIILYAILIKRVKLRVYAAGCILFLGQFLAVTVLSNHVTLLNVLISVTTSLITLISPVRLPSKSPTHSSKPTHRHANSVTTTDFDNGTSWKTQPPSPLPSHSQDSIQLSPKSYITNYRSYLLYFTMLSILAVDFPVFPRRLAKTESYGTSFMDLGVGSFTFAFGLVDAKYHILSAYNTRKVLPLIALAVIRLVSVTLTEYPQHISEYGTHWNFFATLAALPLLTKPLTVLNRATDVQFSWMAIIIAIVFQGVLSHTGLQQWTMDAERTSLLSHNKEGIVSLVGYLCIYLFGLDIGLYSLPQDPYAYFRKRLTKKVAKDKRDKLLVILASFSILYWSLYGGVRVFDVAVSRRVANLPYILWTVAFNTSFLTLFLLIDLINFKTPSRQAVAVPGMLQAISNNGLALFLIANVLTGMVNLSVETIRTNTITSLLILAAYTTALLAIASDAKRQEEERPLQSVLEKPAVSDASQKPPLQAFHLPSLDTLRTKDVVLASSSPRRLDILAQVGVHPRVVASTFDEKLSKEDYLGDPHAYPINTASEKGKEVYERLVLEGEKSGERDSPDLIISADTVVLTPDDAPSLSKGRSWDDASEPMTYTICEKPIDRADQFRMLADASGRELQVVTGVCITYPILQAPGYAQKTFANVTKVHFLDNDETTIERYIDTNEGIDRAGGFALQGLGALLVQGIQGDYNNVVGFPLSDFVRFLDTLIENEEGVFDL
ncbi:hypothetical protein E3P99_01958 [Wallemia hederae]|uniref:GPI-anchored wall transfer protein 1 n=1 Tax=Wallemia hederae TaxID=1540922 RepID=A0A4T0FQ29_9BASI|nr:hypothetical protein E3P99_01958 [Wallemia hederae]